MQPKDTAGSPTQGLLHASAHPSLPPAQPEQVVQFLLARNYHLTALELLVESQHAGKGHEVQDLHQFFADSERFPVEELSKEQPANVKDIQAAGRERESQLALLEYELRLAKEDLQELRRQQSLQQQASSTPPRQQLSGDIASPLPNASSLASTPRQSTEVGNDQPTQQDLQAVNAAIQAHLLMHGYRLSAMTLQEEAASASTNHASLEGNTLWQWLLAARQLQAKVVNVLDAATVTDAIATTEASNTTATGGASEPSEPSTNLNDASKADVFKEVLEAGHESFTVNNACSSSSTEGATYLAEVACLTADLAVAQQKLKDLEEQLAKQRTELSSQTGSKHANSIGMFDIDDATSQPDGAQRSNSARVRSILESPRDPSPQKMRQPTVDALQHQRLQRVCELVRDLLPRLAPSLTLKARIEALPLLTAIAAATTDSSSRTSLANLAVSFISNPDASQRRAMVGCLHDLASMFGPAWTAQTLLPLIVKAVSAPGPERRVLAADALAAVVESNLVDLATHAHVMLTQVHRLVEDRMEQVREAVVSCLSAFLRHISFSKSYYLTVEDMALGLIKDSSETVSQAATSELLPALVSWAQDSDVLTTSLLPKVVTELGRHMRQAVALVQQSQVANKPLPLHARFLNQDFQTAYQLLGLYITLLPVLRAAALLNCPDWARAAVPESETSSTLKPAAATAKPMQDSNQHSSTNKSSNLLPSKDITGSPNSPAHSQAEGNHQSHQPGSDSKALVDHEGSMAGSIADSSRLGQHRRGGSLHLQLDLLQDRSGQASQPLNDLFPARRTRSIGSPRELSSPNATEPTVLSDSKSFSGRMPGQHRAHPGPSDIVGNGMSAIYASHEVEDALFGCWADSDLHMQWKSLQWVVQFVLPELLDCIKALPLVPEARTLRLRLADAVSAMCSAFGVQFTRKVLLPLLTVAAGALPCSMPLQLGVSLAGDSEAQTWPAHVVESAADLLPRTPDAVKLCRERVLPVLVAVVLPSAGLLQSQLTRVMRASDRHDHRWVIEGLADITGALYAACELRPAILPDLLGVLEQLVHSSATGPGLCGVALSHAALAACTPEQVTRRILPALMSLLSTGEQSVQLACCRTLIDTLLVFREQSKVAEPVFAVYDGLLEQGSHEIQSAVVSAAARLASAVAPTALVSAASAQQLEWVLEVVQRVAVQLYLQIQPAAPGTSAAPSSSPSNTSAGVQQRTPEQQKAFASQLFDILRAVHSHEVRLPRLISHLQSAADELLKCKALISDAQISTLQAMVREKPGMASSSSTHMPQVQATSETSHRPLVSNLFGSSTSSTPATAAAATVGGAGGTSSDGSAAEGGMRSRLANLRNRFTRPSPKPKAAAGVEAIPVHTMPGLTLQFSGQVAGQISGQSSGSLAPVSTASRHSSGPSTPTILGLGGLTSLGAPLQPAAPRLNTEGGITKGFFSDDEGDI